MKDSNSAAQVSTRLKTGAMCAFARWWRTAAGVVFHTCASCSSLAAEALGLAQQVFGDTVSTVTAGQAPIHRDDLFQLPQEPRIDLRQFHNLRRRPARVQSPPAANECGQAAAWPAFHAAATPALQPARATAYCGSSERMPFCSASLKVRPMAITSPTDFICVPRVSSAPGNFSNCHLGIFTTT